MGVSIFAVYERANSKQQALLRVRAERALTVALMYRGSQDLPSFGCTTDILDQKSPYEILICTDAELIQSGRRIENAFRALENQAGPRERTQLFDSQRAWLERMLTECTPASEEWEQSDLVNAKGCMLHMFEERVAKLEGAHP
jgi:uncharacterized protein YecT (DUF1311 family)